MKCGNIFQTMCGPHCVATGVLRMAKQTRQEQDSRMSTLYEIWRWQIVLSTQNKYDVEVGEDK